MIKTYVFDEIEVKLTGRIAERAINSVAGKNPRNLQLVEIEPVDRLIEWKKWVRMDQLYEILQ